MVIRKRHQIIPFDVVRSIGRESSIFSSTVKIAVNSGGGHTALLVIGDLSLSSGFYELAHTLHERQLRIVRLLGGTGADRGHTIPEGVRVRPEMLCLRTVPYGLHQSLHRQYADEVWENERRYPIVGWSPKMLLSDPYRTSDFCGTREVKFDEWPMPEGFRGSGDTGETGRWVLAESLRDSPERHQLRDYIMLSYSCAGDEDKLDAEGWIYADEWTDVFSFRANKQGSQVRRRRLWVRLRELIPSSTTNETTPRNDSGTERLASTHSTSTDSTDVVNSSDLREMPILAPTREENDE
jgi:hypothetical protein